MRIKGSLRAIAEKIFLARKWGKTVDFALLLEIELTLTLLALCAAEFSLRERHYYYY